MRTRKPYPWVHEVTNRHGQRFAYLRKPGHPSVTLPLPVGGRAFLEAYHAALEAGPEPVRGATKPGTFAALVHLYLASRLWLELSPQSQRTYRHILDHFVAEHGHRIVAQMEAKHVEAIITAKVATPAAANKLRKVLSLLMRVAILHGWRKDNPVSVVRGCKIKSKGHRTWSDEEIVAFKARHPFGTRAYLALALLLYTGQRRSDVRRMGRQHVKEGTISILQKKGGETIEVSIPILPALQACIDEAMSDRITPAFIVTDYGKPFTDAGFTNWFHDRCKEAGLPKGLSPHGLRKAFCRVAAESGMTVTQIMAISGHQTLTEVMKYIKDADRKKMAADGMEIIKRTGFGNPV